MADSWQDLLDEAIRVQDDVRFNGRSPAGMVSEADWSRLGSVADYVRRVRAMPLQLAPPTPAPAPAPAPGPTSLVPPLPNGAIFGRTKWYPGYGCDLFVPDGTPCVVPLDCVVEEVVYGTGLQGGAEIIFATLDRQRAWRWRHVYAEVSLGQQLKQGARAAYVHDDSLGLLGTMPAWAVQQAGRQFTWQHLDLSYDEGTDQFAPVGGGGGNRSSYAWIVGAGYQGTILARTPGPPDAGIGFEEAIALMTPAGRR